MDAGSNTKTQVRERFEISLPPVEFDDSHESCKSNDDNNSRLSLTGFNGSNGNDESGRSAGNHNRILKRPLSRTSNVLTSGLKLMENQPQTAANSDRAIKSNLRRKPALVRTSSKPMGHNRPESALEEALKAPLPSGPAPKKPPRTSSLLRTEVDGNSNKKNIPLMSPSKTEPCLHRRSQKRLRSIRRTNSFPSSPLERSIKIINRDGSLTRVELRHVYDPPSGEMEDRYWQLTDESSDDDESDLMKRKLLIEDRKKYVRQMSRKVFDSRRKAVYKPRSLSNGTEASCSPSSPSSTLPHPVEPGTRLFDIFLVVDLFYDGQLNKKMPYIKYSYPNNAIIPSGTEHFCFPDSSHWPPQPGQSTSAPAYTIVLTDANGDRMFGHCCRIVPEGHQEPIPITYCLLSRHRAAGFYTKLLNAMVALHGSTDLQRTSMLDHLYSQPFPKPGKSVRLLPHSDLPATNKIMRLLDDRLEDVDLRVLFEQLNETVILHVFGTVLLERKLIFVSQNLSVLSLCINAVQSMIYPFLWHHILIPILPSRMTEFASCPTPFILGILSQNVKDLNSIRPDHGMLVDLDSGKVLHCVGDESTILAKRSIRKLKVGWEEAVALTQKAKTARNALFSESFLRTLVDLCGHYAQHIHVWTETGAKYFERAVFATSHSNSRVCDFLEWFTETAMFSLFIESQLRFGADPTLFDLKILEHAMKFLGSGRKKNNGTSASSDMPNSTILTRKFRNIGDKLRKMNVFS